MLVLFASVVFPPEKLSAYGTIFAAAGSLIAVIFFSASLYYQSIQLREQREQFNTNFSHLRVDAERKAILTAKEMLTDAEEKAIKGVDGLDAIINLPTLYVHGMAYWKNIIKSNDPEEVMSSFQRWLPLETSATTFVSGVKNAAVVYFKALGMGGIDYSKKPEDFVYIYGTLLREAPYFQMIIGTAELLAQSMFMISPGRSTCILAATLSMAITAPPGVIKEDKVQQDIEEHIEKGYPIPAIVNVYRRNKQESE